MVGFGVAPREEDATDRLRLQVTYSEKLANLLIVFHLLAFETVAVNGFSFIIRELEFLIPRFFIMDIACIATFNGFNLTDEDEFAMGEYFPSNFYSIGIQGEGIAKFDLVKGLDCWSKGFVNLS